MGTVVLGRSSSTTITMALLHLLLLLVPAALAAPTSGESGEDYVHLKSLDSGESGEDFEHTLKRFGTSSRDKGTHRPLRNTSGWETQDLTWQQSLRMWSQRSQPSPMRLGGRFRECQVFPRVENSQPRPTTLMTTRPASSPAMQLNTGGGRRRLLLASSITGQV